jgi:hypothetical protein
MKYAITDPRMDGFVTWGVKQDLYKIKWAVDAALEKCPKYAPEDEFLEEHAKQQVWDTLKDKSRGE